MTSPRSLLVTSALPYANGPLHLGHMVEHIQADIWVRFQRMLGHRCYFICGEDAHGTPVMLRAEKLGISPEHLVEASQQEHAKDLREFLVQYDNFHTTHSIENRELASTIYKKLKARGDIVSRTIRQAFDPVKHMFLPDRYVKGECPRCGAPQQYGDSCEMCGATYSPTELINPISVISGVPPIEKDSEHFFFCLDHYEDFLKQWTQSKDGRLQEEVSKKLNEWFEAGLKQWDITRDLPYFGFEIPDALGKYFYVWLDAPIGYMASFKHYCDTLKNQKHPLPSFEEFFDKNSTTELYHFIGKDIVYFHALFWPAILEGSGYRTPTSIFVHGFLTVNGEKMSKSRGTFITARDYLDHLPPECIRYYFASKLGSNIEDIDFQEEDFVLRVNSDLVGKFVNIASRCAVFINKQFNNRLSSVCADKARYQRFVDKGDEIANLYEKREYRHAIREIMQLADEVNRYIDEQKPWVKAKSELDDLVREAHEVCSLGLNLFRLLALYLKPVLSELAEKIQYFLNDPLNWSDRKTPLLNHEIKLFNPLMHRIERPQVANMIATTQKELQQEKQAMKGSNMEPTQSNPKSASESHNVAASINPGHGPLNEPLKEKISIDDFAKIDLRIAKILDATSVPEAQKLLCLKLDIGSEIRQVFAGIKEAYPDPSKLIGKYTVMVANLEPRKMRFGISEGMVLAAGPGGSEIWILEPHEGAQAGMRVK